MDFHIATAIFRHSKRCKSRCGYSPTLCRWHIGYLTVSLLRCKMCIYNSTSSDILQGLSLLSAALSIGFVDSMKYIDMIFENYRAALFTIMCIMLIYPSTYCCDNFDLQNTGKFLMSSRGIDFHSRYAKNYFKTI